MIFVFFNEMKYVYEVYKQRSFSKAAQALSIAQPTLSLMVKKAESRLGGLVFDRSKSPLALTPLGRAYIESAQSILRIEEEFGYYVQANEQCPEGELTIGGTPLFISALLPSLLTAFSSRFPGVRVHLMDRGVPDLVEGMRSGSIDLVLGHNVYDPKLFDHATIRSEEIVLAVSRKIAEITSLRLYRMTSSYVQRGGIQGAAAVPLRLLSDYPFILLKEGTDTRRRSDALCMDSGFTPNVVLETDQELTAYNMAAVGLGAAFVSEALIEYFPTDERLLFFRLAGENARREISIHYDRQRPLSNAAKAFIQMFRNTPVVADSQ